MPYPQRSLFIGGNATPNTILIQLVLTHAHAGNQGRKAHKPNDQRRAPASNLPITGTPLHWSAYRGDLGITWILLKVGVWSSGDTVRQTTQTQLERESTNR